MEIKRVLIVIIVVLLSIPLLYWLYLTFIFGLISHYENQESIELIKHLNLVCSNVSISIVNVSCLFITDNTYSLEIVVRNTGTPLKSIDVSHESRTEVSGILEILSFDEPPLTNNETRLLGPYQFEKIFADEDEYLVVIPSIYKTPEISEDIDQEWCVNKKVEQKLNCI